ncbi:hypothetical protein GUJ93_ZPchr0013g35846 [Zizania palustris]|uniref:t-SNARE coiled-coil homology domain-containing protein n=1 Tax=Zizania palustris TaxID=103762 RepID=A0A8J5WTZ9_ZIZPA|nr:hypothetical protein GUJ93_ZPchr0013g35846 [Zizania palustris]
MASGAYGSREGLTARPAASSSSSEISLQIDPTTADLDDHIFGLRGQVRKLRGVAQEIQSEAKYQNDFISQLQMTLTKAQAGVKNNMRRINKKIIQNDEVARPDGVQRKVPGMISDVGARSYQA